MDMFIRFYCIWLQVYFITFMSNKWGQLNQSHTSHLTAAIVNLVNQKISILIKKKQ